MMALLSTDLDLENDALSLTLDPLIVSAHGLDSVDAKVNRKLDQLIPLASNHLIVDGVQCHDLLKPFAQT